MGGGRDEDSQPLEAKRPILCRQSPQHMGFQNPPLRIQENIINVLL